MNSKEKHYEKDDLTIIWKSELCIHAAECVKRLPKVYKPNDRPWINPEGASKEELISQINACPSGALTYSLKGEESAIENTTRIETMKGGPLRVFGKVVVKDVDGNEIEREKVTGFCRCGASENKPFCDGAHRKIGWDC